MITVRSHIKNSEKRFKSMEIKKLDRKKESDPQGRIKNSCSKNLVNLLQIINKYCSKNLLKISEAYLGSCQTALTELFYENS